MPASNSRGYTPNFERLGRLVGVALGILVALIPPVTGLVTVSFGLAMVMKFLVVFLFVYAACRLGVGWMGKKFNDAVAHQAALAH